MEAFRNHSFLYTDLRSGTSFRHAPVLSAKQGGSPLTDPCPSSQGSNPAGRTHWESPQAEITVKMQEPGRPCPSQQPDHSYTPPWCQALCLATIISRASLHQELKLASAAAHLWLLEPTTGLEPEPAWALSLRHWPLAFTRCLQITQEFL